ncbi:MAG: ABC transporter ATP-binding protein [Fimbriimonadales bacterium]|nr:ABC transporter ATP-binding protein [Fimbriimonadales bacterium]
MDSLLTVRGLTKRFGRLVALDSVSVDFRPGEIHAVVGENGAGKSTLMAHLAGFLVPDRGEIRLGGDLLPAGDPLGCRNRGIAMVHQHFTLVDGLTVLENVALSAGGRGWIAASQLEAQFRRLCEAYGWELEPRAAVASLSVGQKQKLEILKALWGESSIVILDEPTATLSETEAEELFVLLRRLAAEGRIVVLIAHKLREVLSVADRITVLRGGRAVRTVERSEADERALAEWMAGELPEIRPGRAAEEKPVRISVRNLHVRDDLGRLRVRQVCFDVRAGEIVGITGVDGNGQVELAEAIVGIRRPDSGQVMVDGEPPAKVAQSIGYVPQDRQRDGLSLVMSVGDNVLIGLRNGSRFFRGPFLHASSFADHVRSLIDRFGVRCAGPDQTVASLSGGNQQKIVLARALDPFPKVLVAVDPTRGLDFKATAAVHNLLLEAAEGGAAVVLISGSREEVALLANRAFRISMGRLEPWETAAVQELVPC